MGKLTLNNLPEEISRIIEESKIDWSPLDGRWVGNNFVPNAVLESFNGDLDIVKDKVLEVVKIAMENEKK
jgi:hypothetical protein